MRGLSPALLAAQKAQGVVPYLKAIVTDGTTTYTFDNMGDTGCDRRIRGVEGIEEPFGGNAVIRLKNSDQYFAAKNLKGWKVTLGYGAKVNGTYEVSNVAPLFVLSQRDTSLEGELVTELQCLDLWWYTANKLVALAGKRLNGTISKETGNGFELGELVTVYNASDVSVATGRLTSVAGASIIITSTTGTFTAATYATGGDSGAKITLTATGDVNDIAKAGGPDYRKGRSTILEILKAIMPSIVTDVILDSDSPVGQNKVNEYKPTLIARMGYARTFIRQLLQMTPCVGRMQNDSKLHILYPDPAATPDYTYQTDHVFWYQLRERAVIMPNTAVFVNHLSGDLPEGVTQYKGEYEDSDSVTLLGEALIFVGNEPSIETDDEAILFAHAWIDQRKTEAYQGAVRAPMNCGQELYDQVRIIDSRSGVTVTGRAGRIVRRYLAPITSPNHTYEIEVTLGGIVSQAGAIGGPGTLGMDLQDLTTNTLPGKYIPKTMGWQLPVSYQAYIANIDFTSVDYQTVSWTAGNVKFADGRIQAVTAVGSPKTLTATHYMYVIWGNSTLQFSTTYSDAVGPDRVMVGVAAKGSADGINAYVLNPHTDSILINRDKVMDNLVNDLKLASEAVTEAKLAALSVSSGKIQAGAVIAGKIAALSIAAGDIAANAITSDKINAGAVTAAKIDVATLDAISADVGTLTSGTINGVNINISTEGQLTFRYGASYPCYIYTGSSGDLVLLSYTGREVFVYQEGLFANNLRTSGNVKANYLKPYSGSVINFGTGNGDEFDPAASNTRYLGISTKYWFASYANLVNYKTLQAFQHHDDIALMKAIKVKLVDGQEVFDNLPAEVLDKLPNEKIKEIEEFNSELAKAHKRGKRLSKPLLVREPFINAGAIQGLTIGAIKQLIERLEILEAKL